VEVLLKSQGAEKYPTLNT